MCDLKCLQQSSIGSFYMHKILIPKKEKNIPLGKFVLKNLELDFLNCHYLSSILRLKRKLKIDYIFKDEQN